MTKWAAHITWWDKIRHAVARWVLADEVKRVDLERTTFLRLQEEMERNREQFEKEKNSYTVTDMVREKIGAFDPHLLNDEEDLPSVLGDVEAQYAFLSKMKSLNEHKELKVLIDYLTREQIFFIAKYADTVEKQNFGRATLNGFALLQDEIARMAVIYDDRHEKEPEFDEHEVM